MPLLFYLEACPSENQEAPDDDEKPEETDEKTDDQDGDPGGREEFQRMRQTMSTTKLAAKLLSDRLVCIRSPPMFDSYKATNQVR